MADDSALGPEQVDFLKSQGKKILDLLVKLAPIPQGAKDLWKVGRETEKVFSMTTKTYDTGVLTASDLNLNLLHRMSGELSNELSKLARLDENWWIEASGANLFSQSDSTRALEQLRQRRQGLASLREACDGLKTLTVTAFVNAHMNVKGIASLYVPSLVAIDGMVARETVDQFDVCMRLLDAIGAKVELAMRATADMTKYVDRFLTLVNSRDQRAVVPGYQPASGALPAGKR